MASRARSSTQGPRVAFLLKRSAWQIFVQEKGDRRLRSLIKAGDPTVSRLRASHDAHQHTVDEVMAALAKLGARTTEIENDPGELRRKDFDLVLTVGGDGTLLRASHFVADIPVLGINSAPKSSVGFFCGGIAGEAERAIAKAIDGSLPSAILTRMKVTLNGKVIAKRVLNDALFCHASPAATSRYIMTFGDITEEHKSSGFWIGPAAGSTAAQRSAGGKILPLTSSDLQLVAREPYTPRGQKYRLKSFLVAPGASVTVRSKMREGAMFFDGPEERVSPAFGDTIVFTRAEQPIQLMGISQTRRRVRW